jgi:hypothetical protein
VNWNRNTFGEIGILDMPNARLAPDGEVAFTIGTIGAAQRYTLTFQALPWLETAFRYSRFSPAPNAYDRSFSLKMRLLNEEEDFADLSVGIRDLLGTGVYASEYIVASKRIGPVDLTLGAGWGRLAGSGALPNPLAQIFSSFQTRGGTAATGGTVNFGQFFRGARVGLFGGATWHTPIEGLSLFAEYSSDRYTREQLDVPRLFTLRSPVNLGAAYRFGDSFSVQAGWYYGTTYGLRATITGNPFANTPSSQRIGEAVPRKSVRSEEQQRVAVSTLGRRDHSQLFGLGGGDQNLQYTLFNAGAGVRDVSIDGNTLMVNAPGTPNLPAQCARLAGLAAGAGTLARTIAMTDFNNPASAVTLCEINPAEAIALGPRSVDFERRLRTSLAQQGLTLMAASSDGSQASVFYENYTYQMESQAVGRIIRVLMRDADPTVELFNVYPLIDGVTTQQIQVARAAMERLPDSPGAGEIPQAVTLQAAPVRTPDMNRATRSRYPKFDWNFGPQLSNQFFDPQEPLGFRLMATLDARLTLVPGLTISGAASSALFNTFNVSRASNSVLPHVRTDQNLYLDKGAHGISYLNVQYTRKLTPELFATVKAGYLEDMFAGFGGEILWRPQGSRFAIGMTVHQVWQRDFNRLAGLQNYRVLTGHISAYYDMPFFDLNVAIHGGRYLAGDYGGTFEISRRFVSGVEVGAFATFTNVSAARFGEGSFDKGIMLRLPLDWMIPIFTRATYDLNLRSLTRDGGARLANDNSLYHMTRPSSVGDLSRRIGDIASP